MIDHFGDVRAFLRVADTASFTKAAEGLGVTRSAVGKWTTRLEEGVGTRLIHRTTRSVSLTEEGRLFYDHALRILCEVEDAQGDAGWASARTHRPSAPWRAPHPRDLEVRGTLRLNNTEAIRDAALAGCGLVQLRAFLVGEDIQQGRLVPVLQQFEAEQPPICAVYPTRRHVLPKVRRFTDALRDAWAEGRMW